MSGSECADRGHGTNVISRFRGTLPRCNLPRFTDDTLNIADFGKVGQRVDVEQNHPVDMPGISVVGAADAWMWAVWPGEVGVTGEEGDPRLGSSLGGDSRGYRCSSGHLNIQGDEMLQEHSAAQLHIRVSPLTTPSDSHV